MNAQEAERLSIEQKPVWDKKCYNEIFDEIYNAIEIRANMGGKYVIGFCGGKIENGCIRSTILPKAVRDKLILDGFYVRSIYTGTFNTENIICWDKAEIAKYELEDIQRKKKEEKELADLRSKINNHQPKKKWYQIF